MPSRTRRLTLRGRPRSKSNINYVDLRSIFLLAEKHNLDPKRLVDAFFEAVENGPSHCGKLKISCRDVSQDSATLLIEIDDKVVWQYKITLKTIRSPEIRNYLKNNPIIEDEKKKKYHKNQKIGKLRFGMKGVTVNGKIIEIPPAKDVITRWGSQASVSNVKVADNTGSTRLSLWNNQIDLVNVGDEVEIKNCYVAKFASELQLRLGRKGTLSVINQTEKGELMQHSLLR